MMIVTATNARAYSLLPIVMVTVGTNYPQSPVYRPEGAAYHHIFFVEKGSGVLEIEGKSFPLTEGAAVFMRKDVPVRYYGVGEEFKTAWVTFVGDGVDGVLNYLGAEDFAFLKSDSIYPMIVNAYKLAEHNAPPEVLSQSAYGILTTFFYELRAERKSSRLARAKHFVEENYAKMLSVSDIAEALGVSESLVFRLFGEEEGTTPSDYIKSVRIRHAEQLLLSEPSLKIGEVAALSGFADEAYFCKVFKSKTGMTPKKYQSRFVR